VDATDTVEPTFTPATLATTTTADPEVIVPET